MKKDWALIQKMKEVLEKDKKQQQIDTWNWVADDMRAGEENPKNHKLWRH